MDNDFEKIEKACIEHYPIPFSLLNEKQRHNLIDGISANKRFDEVVINVHGNLKIDNEIALKIAYWSIKIGAVVYSFYKKKRSKNVDELKDHVNSEIKGEEVPKTIQNDLKELILKIIEIL